MTPSEDTNTFSLMKEPTLSYLKELQEEIWEEDHEVTINGRGRYHSKTYMVYKPSRPLLISEWLTILEGADKENLACRVENNNFGFEFGLYFYEAPVAPGAPLEKPILSIDWAHLPDGDFKNKVQAAEGYDNKCKVYWSFFKKAFDTPRNKELLELYGLPALQEFHHYIY